jgi:6-phosphogluconolactonase
MLFGSPDRLQNSQLSLMRRIILTKLPHSLGSSGIRMHPSGNAVYVSNRGHNSIGVFPINKNGNIEADQATWTPCGGETPRDFAIDPSGKWLIVGNQDDSTLTVFKIISPENIDPECKTFPCNTPTCIAFPIFQQ